MRALLAFARLSRPLFLYGGFAGVALGTAIARRLGYPLDLGTYLWAQGLVSAFHLMVHYANDYFDREADRHAARTAWSGGSGVLVAGDLPPRVALVAALVCAALGLVATARFALAGNAAVAGLGLAILVCAWCYSAPPLRLTARGLGELDTALVVAVLVPCVGFAAFAGGVEAGLVPALLAPVGASAALMLGVELPDAGADRLAGKHNLAVRLGMARSYIALAGTALFTAAALAAAAWSLRSLAALAVVPGLAVALGLLRLTRTDWRPARAAFLGVALYATTVTGLAVAYALTPA